MLNLIRSVWNSFSQSFASLYHWILNAIAAVYGYVNRLFQSLGNEIISVYRSLESFAHAVNVWVVNEINNIIRAIETGLRDVEQWALRIMNDIGNYAVSVYRWAIQEFDYIIKSIDNAINSIVQWVIKTIWNPLYAFIRSAFAWIDKYGNWLWDVVSNPEKLVAWIARYLLSAWLGILRTWAIPVVRFIMTQFRALIPDFISILEEVLSKVL